MNVGLISCIGLVILVLIFLIVKMLERRGYFQPHKKVSLPKALLGVIIVTLAFFGVIEFIRHFFDIYLTPI